jgi:hypothetical protein
MHWCTHYYSAGNKVTLSRSDIKWSWILPEVVLHINKYHRFCCELCNGIFQYCFCLMAHNYDCVLMHKLIELQSLVDILLHHRQTYRVAVKGASTCQAAQHGVHRLTKTLQVWESWANSITQEHSPVPSESCSWEDCALQRTSNSSHSTYLQSHHPCSMEHLSRQASITHKSHSTWWDCSSSCSAESNPTAYGLPGCPAADMPISNSAHQCREPYASNSITYLNYMYSFIIHTYP